MNKLMPFKKWFFLLCLEISYLLLGACFFYKIESVEEAKRRLVDMQERKVIEELLMVHYVPSINKSQDEIFEKLTEYCGKPMHINMVDEVPPHRWDFYHSLFFVITVVSTIGYGNLAPTTMVGRIVMIFYGLVGIPVNGIVMLTLGEFFGERFTKMYERWKTDKIHDHISNLSLLGKISLYLAPGFLLFIFIPSVVIMIFEGWDYDVAVYYAFVTLTTIGFGDYVAGVQDNHFGETLFTTYKIFLLVWIIIGLGYLVMIIGFISRGMRSKKMKEIEHLLAENIRRTPVKFRALKTMVYEILLMRLKPVYKKGSVAPINFEGRAMSLPDLRLLYEDFNTPCRKRALSETNTKDLPGLQRVQSDSNLHLIDKDLTFTSKKEQQQHDLLRKMSAFVNSYEAKLNQLQGIECFTDEEILESEQYNSQWTIGSMSAVPQNISTPSLKTRTSSITKIPYQSESNDVTWYGQTAALKEQEMRERLKHGRARSRTLPVQQEPLLKLPPEGIFSRLRRRFISTDSYKENDVEKQEIAAGLPQVPQIRMMNRKRAQSESQNLFTSNFFTSEEQREVEQLAKMLITLVDHQEEPKRKMGNVTPPDFSTPRMRRVPIVPLQSRKGSLAPPSPSHFQGGRRFSLRPAEDVTPPPISPALTKQRRFSLRPASNISNTPSPVQRQRMKKDNKDNVIIENEQMK